MPYWEVEIDPPADRWPTDWGAPEDWAGCAIVTYREFLGRDTALVEADEAAITAIRSHPRVHAVVIAQGSYVDSDGATYVVSDNGTICEYAGQG